MRTDDLRLAAGEELRLITQTLLVAVFFHPLTAFVFRNFCFSSFFQRAHREDFNLPISECRLSASETTKRDQYQSRAAKVKGLGCLATIFACSWPRGARLSRRQRTASQKRRLAPAGLSATGYRTARSCSACSAAFTFRRMAAMRPARSITKVVRSVPMYFFPIMLFSTQTP